MKRIGLIAVLAVLAAASAYAQQQFEPAVPKGLPESRVEPPAALGQPVRAAGPQLVMSPRHRNDADARQCLQFTSNMQIHRCAERYRSHAGRAHVTKASARPAGSTTRRADRAKASAVAKPDASRAAAPAKPADMKSAAAPASTAPAPMTPAAKSPETAKAPAPAAKGK